MPNGTTWPGRSRSCENSTLAPRSSPTLAADSTSVERDLSPYWNDYTEELSSVLWLPIKTGLRDLDSTLSGGRLSETAAKSWFSAETVTAPNRSSPRIFSPSCIPSPAGSTDSGDTGRKSRKIRLFPNREQERRLNLWIDAARWCYNETVARLNRTGVAANWKKLKVDIIHFAPDRLRPAPYAVKDIAVRDACRAVSAVRKKNRVLGKGREAREYHRAGFRSRKNPRQGCYAKADAVKPESFYPKLLGPMKMAEPLPDEYGEGRITKHNGQWHLSVSCPAGRRQAETQGGIVSLDPGVRSFLTYFAEDSAGHIGQGDFGRIQRLCAHLDGLLSRAKLETRRFAKRNKYAAAGRVRTRIGNLIDELHHKAAHWLVHNFDVILLPTFETGEMAKRAGRKIRSKTARSMLTFAHYQFQRFLDWKCREYGKALLLTNEAYTSKTVSWTGEIIPNLGGRKVVRDRSGREMDRDINGARGNFLRALADTPALHVSVQEFVGDRL